MYFFFFFYSFFILNSLVFLSVLLSCISLSLTLSFIFSLFCLLWLPDHWLPVFVLFRYISAGDKGWCVSEQISAVTGCVPPLTAAPSFTRLFKPIWPIKLFYSLLWLVSNFRTFYSARVCNVFKNTVNLMQVFRTHGLCD